MNIAPHYFGFTGRGNGKPNIFEQATLSAYQSWINMDGKSPYINQTLPQLENVKSDLEEKYGKNITVKIGFGFQHGSLKKATKKLIRKDIDVLIVAPQMVVDSYFESELHWLKEIHTVLNEDGIGIPVLKTMQLGSFESFVESIVLKVKDELTLYDDNKDIAVFLSNHGFPLVRKGRYDCQSDPDYHLAK